MGEAVRSPFQSSVDRANRLMNPREGGWRVAVHERPQTLQYTFGRIESEDEDDSSIRLEDGRLVRGSDVADYTHLGVSQEPAVNNRKDEP